MVMPLTDVLHDEIHRSIVRDLGLVDADPELRIRIAGGEVGLLAADQFEIALLDADATVRRTAVEGLIGSEPSEMLFVKLRAAFQDPDPALREAVVEVLSELHDPRSLALLLEAQLDGDEIVREEAAEALYRLNAPEM